MVWLDAFDASTVTTNGSEIEMIFDNSLSSNSAIFSGTGPDIASGALNGLDAIQFNGVDTGLTISNSPDLNVGEQTQKTITVALQTSADIATRQVVYEQGGGDSGFTIYLDSNQLYIGAHSESNGWEGDWLSTPIEASTSYVVSLVYDHTSNNFSLYLNGKLSARAEAPVPIASHLSSIGIGTVRDFTKYHDGDFNGPAGHHFAGLIGELSYNNTALAGDEVVNLHAHLMNKWIGTATTLDYETAQTHNVEIQTTDAAGNSYSEVISIAVDNELDANHTVPAPQVIDEDTTLIFAAGTVTEVSVSDSLATTDSRLQVSLLVDDGVLTLSQTDGLTFIEGANNSSNIVIEGTESDINAALDGMSFTPDANFNGAVTLNVTTALEVDLQARYTFEGGNALDQSAGIGDDGTLGGDATTIVDSRRGEVLRLDGSGDYVDIATSFGPPRNATLSAWVNFSICLLYTSPSPRDQRGSRMPSSA